MILIISTLGILAIRILWGIIQKDFSKPKTMDPRGLTLSDISQENLEKALKENLTQSLKHLKNAHKITDHLDEKTTFKSLIKSDIATNIQAIEEIRENIRYHKTPTPFNIKNPGTRV